LNVAPVLASLSMYDLAEIRPATDAWWQGIAAALARAGIDDVPGALTRDAGIDVWRSPELLLSQTCGYPLTHVLAGVVQPVATPVYTADGCSGAEYCSFVVVSADNPAAGIADLRAGVCTYNASDSQSGYNALRSLVAPLAGGEAFFSRVFESGAHATSIELVASGRADVCAVDCVTHALLAKYRPIALEGTRILTATAKVPGLPYVTHAGADQDRLRRLRDGLHAAIEDPRLAGARDALLLAGMQVLDVEAYRRIDEMENAARAAGYAEIH
jgi:ABC-type phosphate/phosphonate transport system substrate-binding protein